MDEKNEISSSIKIRNSHFSRLRGTFKLYNPDSASLGGYIIAKVHSEIKSYLDVRPHNKMSGRFALLPPPVRNVTLSPIADATTRSRPEYRTINYGDAKSMMTGIASDETFKAFVQFESLKNAFPDIKFLKSVKIRFYYSSFEIGANIELQQPNTIWRELGITDVNKPYPTKTLNNAYTLNSNKRYIEFDISKIAEDWISGEINNYGFIISTDDNTRYTFYTRESDYPPELLAEYITNEIYSIGRSDLNSSLFVHGNGLNDLTSYVSVFSNVGFSLLNSQIYIHKYEYPLLNNIFAVIATADPDLEGILTVTIPSESDISGVLTVIVSANSEKDGTISSNAPLLQSTIVIDPNISIMSTLTVASPEYEDMRTHLQISVPDLCSSIAISEYKHINNHLGAHLNPRGYYQDEKISFLNINLRDLKGEISVRAFEHNDLSASVQIPAKLDLLSHLASSSPDTGAVLTTRAYEESILSATIEVWSYSDLSGNTSASRPDVNALLDIKFVNDQVGLLYIKNRNELSSTIDIKNISEITSTITTKNIIQFEGYLNISVPDLSVLLSSRVPGLNDFEGIMLIKKRFVDDLDSFIVVRGKGNRNFVIIF